MKENNPEIPVCPQIPRDGWWIGEPEPLTGLLDPFAKQNMMLQNAQTHQSHIYSTIWCAQRRKQQTTTTTTHFKTILSSIQSVVCCDFLLLLSSIDDTHLFASQRAISPALQAQAFVWCSMAHNLHRWIFIGFGHGTFCRISKSVKILILSLMSRSRALRAKMQVMPVGQILFRTKRSAHYKSNTNAMNKNKNNNNKLMLILMDEKWERKQHILRLKAWQWLSTKQHWRSQFQFYVFFCCCCDDQSSGCFIRFFLFGASLIVWEEMSEIRSNLLFNLQLRMNMTNQTRINGKNDKILSNFHCERAERVFTMEFDQFHLESIVEPRRMNKNRSTEDWFWNCLHILSTVIVGPSDNASLSRS